MKTYPLTELLAKHGLRRVDLANALGVDKSLITRWAQKNVPAERVAEIERVTGISRHDLRPDIFVPPLIGSEFDRVTS